MEKDAQEKIQRLQLLEQSMQSFLMQRQQFQGQMIEVDSALKELETAETAYKIVGNIMISANKENLIKDLKEKKETVELRIKTLEKQEESTRKKADSLQKEVMENLETEK